jgi:anti-anti-sigma factor
VADHTAFGSTHDVLPFGSTVVGSEPPPDPVLVERGPTTRTSSKGGFMLKIHTQYLGRNVVLNLQGRIVIGETRGLCDAFSSYSQASAIVLDLAGVNTLDAHGLGILLQLRERAELQGIEFRLQNVTKIVNRVLEITRLDSVFEVTTPRGCWSRAAFAGASAMRVASCV